MTDIAHSNQALGVGALISASFSIFFRRIVPIMLVGTVIYFVTTVLSGLVLGFDVAFGQDPTAFETTQDFFPVIAVLLVSLLSGALYTSVVTLLAYDAKLGRPVRLGGYIGAALPVLLVIILLQFIVTLLVGLGVFALFIGALWVYAVFSVVVPVAVIERAGFGSLGRSAALTREYRWPIIGLFVVMFLIAMAISAVLMGVLSGFLIVTGGQIGLVTGIIYAALNAVVSAFSGGFVVVMTALLYARLREIKDGIGVASLADVFR